MLDVKRQSKTRNKKIIKDWILFKNNNNNKFDNQIFLIGTRQMKSLIYSHCENFQNVREKKSISEYFPNKILNSMNLNRDGRFKPAGSK